MHIVFFVCALTSIAAVVLICLFLFANGIPAMKEIGLLNFLTGAKWKPGNDIYGIFPMIVGSIYATAGAVIVGVPSGFHRSEAFCLPEKKPGAMALTRMPTLEKCTASHWVKFETADFAPEYAGILVSGV